MSTKKTYRTIAMIMALLMFSSSVGFSMDMHFCGNEFKTLSFFGEAEACEVMQIKQEKESKHSCCESVKEESNNHNNLGQVYDSNCCHNEKIVFESVGDFETSNFPLEQSQHVYSAYLVIVPHLDLFDAFENQINYSFYNPPPLVKDISILHQVFRI